ncbi:hypothetical protein [Gimesia chilikensis]|uniref:hypothetical protein n=1 Tax=Gimesia chilikensis TaxID=2605989 RepID=UPI00118844FD|nr:hypothetical protein [Gimesia chilikensis]QDT85977.1 hypothetical protein MalM14_36490 [Gimesia chilikensis]
MKPFIVCCILCALPMTARATDRYYFDIHVQSPSGHYQVDATSPDNQGPNGKAFQANFTYKCVDTRTGKTIWTRKQPMREPQRFNFGDSSFEIAVPKEGSPRIIIVSNLGAAVILAANDNLITISSQGQKTGEINLVKDALQKEESERLMYHSWGGSNWSRLAAWYFFELPEGEIFVIRPAWGPRILVEVDKGKLVSGDVSLIGPALEAEKQLVLDATRTKIELDNHEWSLLQAAYLAGSLNLHEAIPFLKSLEMSKYSETNSARGHPDGVNFNNEVDPFRYHTYDLRQTAQLSLRRLGVAPRNLPCHRFMIERGGEAFPFTPKKQTQPRHKNATQVKTGMSAKEVLNTIGAPDYINDDSWSYDMDAEVPFSLTLTFDTYNVTAIKKEAPLWRTGLARDKALAF